MIERYTLLTNLLFVVVNGVRTHCAALLLCSEQSVANPRRRRCQLRGFGVDSRWPVFDLDVPTIEYTSVNASTQGAFIAEEGGALKPLCSGQILTFAKNGPRVSLYCHDRDRPVHVDTFEGRSDDDDDDTISRVWATLSERARGYHYVTPKETLDEFRELLQRTWFDGHPPVSRPTLTPTPAAQKADNADAANLKEEAVRREAFIQGFVSARDPKTARSTLALLPEAEIAYAHWCFPGVAPGDFGV